MRHWYSPKELAGLPGLPTTVRGVRMHAKSEQWAWRKRKASGGGREYHVESLSREVRNALVMRAAASQAALLPAAPSPVPAAPPAAPAPAAEQASPQPPLSAEQVAALRSLEATLPQLLSAEQVAALRSLEATLPQAVPAEEPAAPPAKPPRRDAIKLAEFKGTPAEQRDHEALWAAYNALAPKAKDRCQYRLRYLVALHELREEGNSHNKALALVTEEAGAPSKSSLNRWWAKVRPYPMSVWLPLLTSGHWGAYRTAPFDQAAWESFCDDYLRPEAPAFTSCYRRLLAKAEQEGWSVPSASAVRVRYLREIPAAASKLARQGAKEAERMFPAQTRDKSALHAMEAVNADGHMLDLFCKFEDGSVGRPQLIAWQDIYSGMILSWRLAQTENAGAVVLSFGDMVERWGIPRIAVLDNGRAFASKWMTGRAKTRFRFKIKAEEPAGLLTMLGVQVRWATPYHGQAKPIERAFRDLAEEVSKHPACAGAYTGNRPDAKPENYQSSAVLWADLKRLLADRIQEHNQRSGRRSSVCAGRSFAQAFKESYEQATVPQAATHQRPLWRLAAQGVRSRGPTGEVQLGDNRYWCEALTTQIGKDVVVRFDPDNLHQDVFVYTPAGQPLGVAECIEKTGFADLEAAKAHTRERRKFVRKHREASKIGRQLAKHDPIAALPPLEEEPEPLKSNVVRGIFGAQIKQDNPGLMSDEEADKLTEWTSSLAGDSEYKRRAMLPVKKEASG